MNRPIGVVSGDGVPVRDGVSFQSTICNLGSGGKSADLRCMILSLLWGAGDFLLFLALSFDPPGVWAPHLVFDNPSRAEPGIKCSPESWRTE